MTTVQIQLRNDTAADWVTANPTLKQGEFGFELVTGNIKVGDGTTAWNDLPYNNSGGALIPNGSRGTPNLITASGLTILGIQREVQFIKGSGGPVVVTGAPAIAVGTTVGQELILVCVDNTNTVTLNDGNGLSLNGPIVMNATGAGAWIYLVWDGTNWSEVSRR